MLGPRSFVTSIKTKTTKRMRIRTECQSAPEGQLYKDGDDETYHVLLDAAKHMSRDELSELEEDLRLYAETRLIGLHMSRLLRLLRHASVAATLSGIEHLHLKATDAVNDKAG